MVSPEQSAILDKVWAGFSPANELKPFAVLDLVHTLLFIKQLDETQAEKGKISVLSGDPIHDPIYTPEQQDLRWSSFQYLDQDTQFELFFGKDGVLEFAKSRPEYKMLRRFEKGDKPLIPPRFLLSETIGLINQLNVPNDAARNEMIDYLAKKAGAHKHLPAREASKTDDYKAHNPEILKKSTFGPLQPEENVAVPQTEPVKSARLQEVPEESEEYEQEYLESPGMETPRKKGFSRSFYKTLLFLFIGAFVVTLLYFNLKKPDDTASSISSPGPSKNSREVDSVTASTPAGQPAKNDTADTKNAAGKPILPGPEAAIPPKPEEKTAVTANSRKIISKPTVIDGDTVHDAGNDEAQQNNSTGNSIKGRYKIVGKAYFHDEPDESTRRNAFVVHWNNSYATLEALDETTNFIYVVFRNHKKQVSRGWLRKKDLIPVE